MSSQPVVPDRVHTLPSLPYRYLHCHGVIDKRRHIDQKGCTGMLLFSIRVLRTLAVHWADCCLIIIRSEFAKHRAGRLSEIGVERCGVIAPSLIETVVESH